MAGGVETTGDGTKSIVKIVSNIFISFIGSGVLGLPFAFKEAGVLEGVLVMIFVCSVSVKAMLLVVDCKYALTDKPSGGSLPLKTRNGVIGSKSEDQEKLLGADDDADVTAKAAVPQAHSQDISYGDLGYHALGTFGMVLVDWAIILSQTGFCCAYLLFITSNLEAYFGIHQNYWLIALLPAEFAVCLFRNLKKLAFTSLFAQISNLMAFAVVFYFDFDQFNHLKKGMHPKEFSIEGLPFFLCIAIYCYEGAGMILSLEASLHRDVRHNFKKYFLMTIALVTVLYISFGVSGYLSFGTETQDIITLNLPAPSGGGMNFSMVVTLCLSLSLFFTYPVMMFPVTSILERKLHIDSKSPIYKPLTLRVLLVSITGIVVIIIPDFGNLMALIGATCCIWLAFILPAVFHMIICNKIITRKEKLIDYLIIAMGIAGTTFGLIDAVQRMSGRIDSTTKEVITTIVPPANEKHLHGSVDQAVEGVTQAVNFAVSLANETVSKVNNLANSSGQS